MSALKDPVLADGDRTTADLRFCGEQFESIRGDLIDLTAGHSVAQLEWQPNASTWSIAQCIEHLSAATEVDLRRLTAMIVLAGAAHRGRPGPWRLRTQTPSLILHDSPRASLGSPSGAPLAPPATNAAQAVNRFLTLNRRLLEVIERAGRIAPLVSRNRTSAVLLDLVGHSLQLNALHHWRYLLQARRVTEFPAFPHH
jgi:hypothetical protein